MADKGKPGGGASGAGAGDDERDEDVFAVRARGTVEQLRAVVESGEYDTGDHPRFTPDREGDRGGSGRVDLFVTRDQIRAIEARGLTVEVASNQSSRARARIAELGEGDRYEGGKVTPRGLGRKIGGRDDRGGPSRRMERPS
jgi:hypothetical protein